MLANPVADHLVDRVTDWPGACSLPQHLWGLPKTVKRPPGFFREDGPMPDEVTLRAERPDGFEQLSEREWVDMVAAAVRAEEDRARAERAEKKLRVLGRKAVLCAEHTDRPSTVEPRRGLRPYLACRNTGRRVSELRALKAFRAAYRGALRRYVAGERRIVFPAGTYRLAALGVRCAEPPPPS